MLNLACYGGHLGFAIHTKNEILISVRDYPITMKKKFSKKFTSLYF
jgi:hypothetical protein